MTPPPDSDARVSAAANSDLILELSSRAAQAHFGLSDRAVAEAKHVANVTWPRERVLRVVARVRAARWRKRVLSHEFYHPGVHRRLLLEGLSCARVGNDYRISAQMVHIFGSEMKELAEMTGRPLNTVLSEIEAAARQPDAKDAVNPQRGHYAGSAQRAAAAKRARSVIRSR
jgi:hypothetical protein